MAVVYARLALFARSDLAEAALLIGDIMAEQENLEAAIEAYQAVAPDSPLRFLAELRRARALHDMEREDEAFALLEKLATAEPERIDALVQLGDLLRHDDRFAEAEPAYSRAIERTRPARARALDACSTRAASPTSAPSAGRRPRRTSCTPWSSSPSSRSCSTISATAGSTWA